MKINKLILASCFVTMLGTHGIMKGEDVKFMRSSIYTVLVNSNDQNQRLDREAIETDSAGYALTLQESGLSSLGGVPQMVFPSIAIPEQFNDHNLQWRIIDFDALTADMTDEEAKAPAPKAAVPASS